jgi:hypothetical protein
VTDGTGRARPLGRALLVAVLLLTGCTARPAPPADRCTLLQQRYGLTPCPADPIPVESVPVKNLDPTISDVQARQLAQAYLRSRALYYLAVQDNSDRFFDAGVIDLPEATPMMFEAESSHIKDARAHKGKLVLAARSTLTSISVVPLPDELRDSLGVRPLPIENGIVITVTGPEQQVIRVPGQPDQPVSTLGAGDGYSLLLGGVLVTREGLPETFAELGQWECLDPDTKGACKLSVTADPDPDPSGSSPP